MPRQSEDRRVGRRREYELGRWILTVTVVVVAWTEAPVCNGGQSVDLACPFGSRAAFERLSSAYARGPHSAFAASCAPRSSGRGALFSQPSKTLLQLPTTLSVAPHAALRHCTLLPSKHIGALLPGGLRKRMATELHISLTTYDNNDDEVKKDYQRADEDGSRIFISGLSPSVDEKRLILALQSYKSVVEVKLAKPGLGFALFMDPASADVALEGLQNIKLGGQPITVRRARSFYILQQQQATMRSAIGQRMREQGVMPPKYDLQRRIDNMPPPAARPSPPTPSSLDMRRASLSTSGPPPPAARRSAPTGGVAAQGKGEIRAAVSNLNLPPTEADDHMYTQGEGEAETSLLAEAVFQQEERTTV